MPVLMCRPTYFNVSYEINPWMKEQIGKVNYISALRQWDLLVESISKHTTVYLLNGELGIPDLVFTANAGSIFKNTVVLSRFKYHQRQLEEPVFRQWFESKGYIVVQPTHNFEGDGDLLRDSVGRVWLGTGFRTDSNASTEIEKITNQKITELELVDPRWYHLDTCFCPLPNGELVWYPGAFSINSQTLIKESFNKTIEVSLKDAEAFACNAVCIKDQIFMPHAANAQHKLNILGYNVNAFDLGEFQKSGGSAKCLTLQFD